MSWGGSKPAPDQNFPAVSSEWPNDDEIAAAGRIREVNKEAIAKLKDAARDVVGDLRIVRFLRARHHNEKEAAQWYGEFLKNRIEECPEIETQVRPTVIGLSPEAFMAWWRERCHPSLVLCPWAGTTPDNALVMIGRPGQIDAEKFTEERADIPLSHDFLLIVAALEWILWYLDDESHRQHKVLYMIKVMDMNGLGSDGRKVPIFVSKMKEFMVQMLQTMQKPYCEHDACFVVLNAPFVFRMVWGVISLVLTTKQKGKVMLLGNTSDKKVSDRLLQLVPASMLPRDIGGERQGLQNVYPPTPASEIPGWISRMSSIQMWPPAPPPAAAPSSAGGEAGATLAPPAKRLSTGGLSTGRASTGRAVTVSTVRAGTMCSTTAVAGDVRAATQTSTIAQAGDVPGTGHPKQQQQCCAVS